MPVDTIAKTIAAPTPLPSTIHRHKCGGWIESNPHYADRLASAGLTTASAILDLQGEVVSGHADRHVVRVELARWPRALYLKRQHRVGWRERLRQWREGFGWVSRCEREARILRELANDGFACPKWLAYGEDDKGRAFLLVEELTDLIDLRRLLIDTRLSQTDRNRFAESLGQTVAELHAAGFVTPDLTAKHVFVYPQSRAIAVIDWQSSRRIASVGFRDRVESLAALHASLATDLADLAVRRRVLWSYLRVARLHCWHGPRFSEVARAIVSRNQLLLRRRSIQDQRYPTSAEQRLVWLAGEAVCAIPDVATVWPRPPICRPFYGRSTSNDPQPDRIKLPDGRLAELMRFRTIAPLGRFVAHLRCRPWRSPGATLGRVLFHLQRYGIPAPRLLAFGQRETGRVTAESFVLYEPPTGVPLKVWLAQSHSPADRIEVLRQAIEITERLHVAGCRGKQAAAPLWVKNAHTLEVTVGGVGEIRLMRHVTARMQRDDLRAIQKLFVRRWTEAR